MLTKQKEKVCNSEHKYNRYGMVWFVTTKLIVNTMCNTVHNKQCTLQVIAISIGKKENHQSIANLGEITKTYKFK